MPRHYTTIRWPSVCIWWILLFVCDALAFAQVYTMTPAPSAVDNPLKGLVPYARPTPGRFPHSLEFNYLALSQIMKGEDEYDWTAMEDLLGDIASRGNQAVIRIFLEYPGKKEGIPPFLIEQGLKVHRYLNTNTAPFPPTEVATPDYQNPKLRAALRSFIKEWGKKYDGDPRLGFITAGLLGTWGEWHTYPKTELWASQEVQREVLDAYTQAFSRTPILLRYPAKAGHYSQTENASRPFGYHDDSFAWATLETGKKEYDWFYMPALKAAGKPALDKWKSCPIGGEIRPEVWGKIFDAPTQWPDKAQDIQQCIDSTHATWLMDTGMFREAPGESRSLQAANAVRRMGYDLHVSRVRFEPGQTKSNRANGLQIIVEIKNQGVAPFYADWPTEIGFLDKQGKLTKISQADQLSIRGILPDPKPTIRKQELPLEGIEPGAYQVLMRIAQPLPNGKPLRFANGEQDKHLAGWLSLGVFDHK